MANVGIRGAKTILIFSMLVMGACGLMYEYVLSVMGNYLMGTSHEQIFIIIGLMLFAMGIGSITQRVLTRHLVEAFLLLEILLGLLGGVSGLAIYAAHAHWESFAIILYGFAFIIGALIGMEIPILIRINETYSDSLRTNLSEILTVDYVGALIGAFLFTYVFLVYVPLTKISVILGLANTFLALLAFVFFRSLIERKWIIGVVMAVVLPALVVALFYVEKITLHIEQKYYRDPIVFRQNTPYQHLVLTKMDDRINFYINGHLQFSSMDEGIYHEYLVHMPMVLAPQKERVLILGGGDGLAAREVLKYPSVKEVVLVDIDPAVTRLARTQPDLVRLNKGALKDARVVTLPAGGLTKGKKINAYIPDRRLTEAPDSEMKPVGKVHILHVDADKFVSHVKGKFDVALADFPDPGLIELAKLYSLDFYRALRKRLHPGSVVSVQSGSPFYAKKAFLCIGKTLEQAGFRVLPYHGSVPSFHGQWGWHLGWLDNRSPRDVKKSFAQLSDFGVSTHHLSPELARASFVFGKDQLVAQNLRINTKMSPVLVHYYRNSWEKW